MVGTVMASFLGVALLARVLVRTIKNPARATGSLPARPLERRDENAENFEPFVVAKPAMRGYDTPELYREDRMARLERSTGGKQLS